MSSLRLFASSILFQLQRHRCLGPGSHPVLILLGVLLLQACGSDGHRQGHRFDNGNWTYADSLAFEYVIQDTVQPRDVRFGLVVNEDYPYRNLYVRFRVEGPRGRVQTSLREFLLAEVDGTWHVDPDWGGHYRFEQTLLRGVVFDVPGTYTFRLIQYMRTDTLRGVESVSLQLDEDG